EYGATYMVLKSMTSAGVVLPIIQALSAHPDWALVFADGLFIVFVRDGPNTSEYIKQHRIDKRIIFEHIIKEASHYSCIGTPLVQVYYTQARMYLFMGQRDKAKDLLREAYEETGSPILRDLLIQLNQ
ncbi:MAG: hypothetical protein FWH25_03310, partial [Syntrophorhabdaceae bacterium]|nr:hypothetical protein [Syntrophorhabdaceae bacterium]